MVDRFAGSEEEFLYCLRLLAKDEGVQRNDSQLMALLDGELSILCDTFRIELSNGPSSARATLGAGIHALIHQLKPRDARQQRRPQQRERQYRFAVAVSFAVVSQVELAGLKLQERRKWLATEAPKTLRIAERTGRRDFDDAVEQLAVMLASPQFVLPVPVVPSHVGEKQRNWLLLIGAPLAAVVLAGTFTLIVQRGSTPSAGSIATSSASSSAAQPTRRQVAGDTTADLPYGLTINTNLHEMPVAGEQLSGGLPMFVFPKGKLPPAPPTTGKCGELEWYDWAKEQGAADLENTRLFFSVVARDKPVHIHNARVKFDEKKASATGDAVRCPIGGYPGKQYLRVNLDEGTVAYREGWDDAPKDLQRNVPFVLDVTAGVSQNVLVRGVTTACHCKWYLELDVEVDGQRFTHRIDNHGKPFETAPKQGAYTGYMAVGGSWVPSS